MHALTGWIPERIALRSKDDNFNAAAIFDRLESGLANGRCLITVATGELSDNTAERTGLVSSHAYAVLNLKEINVSLVESREECRPDIIRIIMKLIMKICIISGRQIITIEKSMVTFTVERKLFRA